MKVKVPIPKGGENNLESKFLRAQSGDPEAVKAYREALGEPQECKKCGHKHREPVCEKCMDGEPYFERRCLGEVIKPHCMGMEFPKREK